MKKRRRILPPKRQFIFIAIIESRGSGRRWDARGFSQEEARQVGEGIAQLKDCIFRGIRRVPLEPNIEED